MEGEGSKWLRQWMRVTAGEVEGSPDKMLMMLKWLAKMFSRTDKFVGLLCILGPPGGGKGTILYAARKFGGEGRGRLAHNMGAGYLFDDRIRGSEECKPVLAGLAGKAVGYSDEYPDKVMNPETIKPLISAPRLAVFSRYASATMAASANVP